MVSNFSSMMSRLLNRNDSDQVNLAENKYCLMCSTDLLESDMYKKHKVCHTCGFHYSISAKDRIESLVDFQSFKDCLLYTSPSPRD